MDTVCYNSIFSMDSGLKQKPIYSTSKITLVDYKIESLKEIKEIECSLKSADYDQRYFTAKQHREGK